MLSLLHIENIAVIENADLKPSTGFTVLSGETGAGKSIVLDAIGALMGQRTSRDLIRNGASKGFVSGVFTNIPVQLQDKLKEMELLGDEVDTLYLQRQISLDGKSVCRVNMRPVSTAVLKILSPYLINIHGQHDGQKLMDEQYHIEYLDRFCNAETLLQAYLPLYQTLSALKQKIKALDGDEQERLQKIDILTYQAQEIMQADLQPDEETELLRKKAMFDNAGALLDAYETAFIALDGVDTDIAGSIEQLSTASRAIESIADVSEETKALFEQAEEVKYLAIELRDSIAGQRAKIDFSPEERIAIEDRLGLIHQLCQKYGGTVEAVLAYYARITEELERLQHTDDTRDQLMAEYRTNLQKAKKVAMQLTELRRDGAQRLSRQIIAELADLDMKRVQMDIHVETGTKLTSHGMDTVTFLISVNPGEPLKALSKVASGGELSRIMLAMKNVMTADEPVGTLIFDEIDTGVSGRAAQKIAYKLMSIAQKKQTLCVTHLPQIAVMGDTHLLIAKQIRNERSYTEVTPLTAEQRNYEIARMIAGDQITDTTLRSAQELLTAASEAKKEEKQKNAAI